MARKSPFAAATIEAAYDAYCAMVLPLAKGRGEKATKPNKKKWLKDNAERYAAHQATMAENNVKAVAEARNEAPGDLAHALAEAIQAGKTPEDIGAIVLAHAGGTPVEPELREVRDTPQDAARNAVLWRLNKEGLLGEALELAADDYITQAEGIALLTKHFGELKKA